MRKNFGRKHLKRGLALLLAVVMVFTTTLVNMDTVLAETADSTSESENTNYEDPQPSDDEMGTQLTELSESDTGEMYPSYRVRKLDDAASFEAVKADPELLWEEGASWEETHTISASDALDQYLKDAGTEYVVIQQVAQSAHQTLNKTLRLPDNIKGALLVPAWDEEAETETAWLLNELYIPGPETCIYLYDLVIDTEGSDELTIDFTGTNIADTGLNKKAVFKHSVINAPIRCDSTSGTIMFLEDNILTGYSAQCRTEFIEAEGYDYVDLLINGDAGLSFDEIIGDLGVSIVYNGYPENPESLPHFNKEIFLGVTIDDEKYSKDVTISFWQYQELPFWLNESTKEGTEEEEESWWEAVPAVPLEAGTQIAHFAGGTDAEKEKVGHHVLYFAHDTETNLQINPVTGKLEEADDWWEEPAYRVLKLDDETAFEKAVEAPERIWSEDNGDLWNDIDNLDEYLGTDGVEYVVIQATQASHNSENKRLELPANIKGAILVPDWDEADATVEWQLDELKIQGADTGVYLYDLVIDTAGNERFTVDFSAAGNHTGKAVFKNVAVNAQIYCDSEAGTIGFLENNILTGYSVKCETEFHEYGNLLINGDAGISFEGISGDTEPQIILNGYPQNPESLPHFNKEINLDKGTDEEGNEYDRGVTVCFWQYKELPFWLDKSIEEWWEAVPAETLKAGTQIAYFAGGTNAEKELIGCKVFYYAHDTENTLHINPHTGRLEEDGAEPEKAAYAVIKLGNAASFAEIKENVGLIWDESGYGASWDGTDALDEYLRSDGMEYVVIQATQASHNSESKKLELPANIKGAILVPGWDEEADAAVEWQLDELKIQGADTDVYLYDLVIDTAGNERFTVDFSAAGNHAGKAVFKNVVVNAQIYCDSAAGTIGFLENNILTGYSVKCETEFREYGNLLINGDAGISFEGISGDTDPQIILNGYPQNPESLPHFNKEINLDKGTDEDGNEYDRGINICVWQYKETPFWLDKSIEEWWESVPAEALEAGTQLAYFAGGTNAEKERIGCKVYYYAHDIEHNLHINPHTGRLEDDNAEPEKAAYAVIKLDNAASFAEIKENTGLIWDENRYGASWDGTDDLDEYLESNGMEYVVICAAQASHNSESKKLELPANIKGAMLVSDWDEEADARVEWQLDTLIAKGEKEMILDNVDFAPSKKKLSIAAETGTVKVVFAESSVDGGLELSGSVDITFRHSRIYGDINAVNDTDAGTVAVRIEEMLIADGLSGYSKLNVYGDTLFLVRNPKTVVIENCEFIKNGEEVQSFNLVYNGYPKETSALPVLKDPIVTPENYDINLRFVQKDDTAFWDKENWWEQTPDEVLSSGTQIAHADMTDEQFESLTQSFWYDTKQGENEQNVIKLVRDQAGKVLIQRHNPDTGKQIVDFELSAAKEKVYDGTAFVIGADSVKNNCGYTGSTELAWESKSGTPLAEAPKNAGEYVLKISVPETVEEYEGCSRIDIKITARTVTVRLKPDATETGKDPVGYEIIWTGFINGDTYLKQAEVVRGPETTDAAGKYYTLGTKGGDAGSNYVITHAEPVRISIIEDTKPEVPEPEDRRPRINSVLFPKKQAQYSAVYTGEQIRPVMVVAYQYRDEKGRAKTQNLKLNVDYTVSYTDNVNKGTNTAKVTVKGIGEYTGVITKEFSITPKSIKNVTLSPVGDILHGDTPTVTVLDGTYELVEGEDYKINLSTKGSATEDTQCVLTVTGIGNYEGTSKKSAKFNILKEATATSTEIKSIASDSVTVEFKKLPAKGYTYSGKANKPAVVVKDGGVKVPASQYKVIYTNNVNAGTQTASVRVVGVSKKGKGYYGISKELKFDIKQKDFSKVSVSSIAARPMTGSLDYITMTVKDGKRILTEGRDYTVDYSNIANKDGSLKDVAIGQKYAVTLKPVSGGNYTNTSGKTVYVKFGQLNLASKTATVSVKITDAAQNKVEVMYNGTLLKENTDYTAQVKQDKKKSTYTVTIKAIKKSAYKGKRVMKNLTVGSGQ